MRRANIPVLVALACLGVLQLGCTPRPVLFEPGRPDAACATVESCVVTAFHAIRDDVVATSDARFADLRTMEPTASGSSYWLQYGFGKVTLHGQKGPAEFDPANACELGVAVRIGGVPRKSPSPSYDARTKSGRLVEIQFHFIAADEALRVRVDAIIEMRVRQLRAVVREMP